MKISNISEHIAKRKLEFEQLNQQNEQLLQEAYMRTIGNSKIPNEERKSSPVVESPSKKFVNSYYRRNKSNDACKQIQKTIDIVNNRRNVEKEQQQQVQFVQVEEKPHKKEMPNHDDNISQETKSQFTDNTFENTLNKRVFSNQINNVSKEIRESRAQNVQQYLLDPRGHREQIDLNSQEDQFNEDEMAQEPVPEQIHHNGDSQVLDFVEQNDGYTRQNLLAQKRSNTTFKKDSDQGSSPTQLHYQSRRKFSNLIENIDNDQQELNQDILDTQIEFQVQNHEMQPEEPVSIGYNCYDDQPQLDYDSNNVLNINTANKKEMNMDHMPINMFEHEEEPQLAEPSQHEEYYQDQNQGVYQGSSSRRNSKNSRNHYSNGGYQHKTSDTYKRGAYNRRPSQNNQQYQSSYTYSNNSRSGRLAQNYINSASQSNLQRQQRPNYKSNLQINHSEVIEDMRQKYQPKTPNAQSMSYGGGNTSSRRSYQQKQSSHMKPYGQQNHYQPKSRQMIDNSPISQHSRQNSYVGNKNQHTANSRSTANSQYNGLKSGRVKYQVKKSHNTSDQQITPELIKQEMIESFHKIRLDLYSDILRIKKPQVQAFTASQMLCKLVNSFRGGSQKTNNDLLFQDWQSIQNFVHRKPNVIKFNQEITQLIQHMILSSDYLKQLQQGQLKNHLNKLIKIQTQYFGTESLDYIMKQFQTNRNFQQIARTCYTIVRYVLHQAGHDDLLYLGGSGQQNQDYDDDVQSQNSYLSRSNGRNSQRSRASRNSKRSYFGSQKQSYKYVPKKQQSMVSSGQKIDQSFPSDNDQNITPKSTQHGTGQMHKSLYLKSKQQSLVENAKTPREVVQLTKSPLDGRMAIRAKKQSTQSNGSVTRSLKGNSKLMNHSFANQKQDQEDNLSINSKNLGMRSHHIYSNSKSNHDFNQSASKAHLPQAASATPPVPIPQHQSSMQNQNHSSRKLYEIMLQKQKQISHDKYERLTLNSVTQSQKKRLNGLGKLSQASQKSPMHNDSANVKTPIKAFRGEFHNNHKLGSHNKDQSTYMSAKQSYPVNIGIQSMNERSSAGRRSRHSRASCNKVSPQKLGFLGEYDGGLDTEECSPQKSIKYSPIKASPQKYYSKKSSVTREPKVQLQKESDSPRQPQILNITTGGLATPVEFTMLDNATDKSPSEIGSATGFTKKRKSRKERSRSGTMSKNQSKINISNIVSIKNSEMDNSMVVNAEQIELEEPKIMTQQKYANTLLPLQMKQESLPQHQESNFTNDPIPQFTDEDKNDDNFTLQICKIEENHQSSMFCHTEGSENQMDILDQMQTQVPAPIALEEIPISPALKIENERPSELVMMTLQVPVLAEKEETFVEDDEEQQLQEVVVEDQLSEQEQQQLEMEVHEQEEEIPSTTPSQNPVSERQEVEHDQVSHQELEEEYSLDEKLETPSSAQQQSSERQNESSSSPFDPYIEAQKIAMLMKEEIAHQVTINVDDEEETSEQEQEEEEQEEEEQSPLNIKNVQVSRYPQSLKQSIDFDQQVREQTGQVFDEKSEGQIEDGYCVDDTEQSEHEPQNSHRTNKAEMNMQTLGIGIATPQRPGIHFSKGSISTTKSQYEITVKRSHQQNLFESYQNDEQVINIQDDEEEDPLPRDDSPLKILQSATTPTITPCVIPSRVLNTPQGEARVIEQEQNQSSSKSDSEYCMQEIVSPFRNLSQMSPLNQRKMSPANRLSHLDSANWQINPVAVKVEDLPEEVAHSPVLGNATYDDSDQAVSDIVYSSPGGQNSSFCESPVRPFHKLNIIPQNRTSIVISPGKLKQHVSQTRAQILEQILVTQKEIEDNSPSKTQYDIQMIRQLKQRRLESKMKNGVIEVTVSRNDDIIERVQNSIRARNASKK